MVDIWLLWFLAAGALVFLTRRSVLRVRKWRMRRLAEGEQGASYTLSLVLIFPIYVFLICLIVECSLMMVVKIGTTYAAYAAARSAIVQLPAEPKDPDEAEEIVRKAAVQAMAPFASGRDVHRRGTPLMLQPISVDGTAYYGAYKFYTKGVAPSTYVIQKYQYADLATKVTIEPQSDAPNAELKVIVEYEMPINVPGIGRFIGDSSSWVLAPFYTRKIQSSVLLEQEGPQSANQLLGIKYDSSI